MCLCNVEVVARGRTPSYLTSHHIRVPRDSSIDSRSDSARHMDEQRLIRLIKAYRNFYIASSSSSSSSSSSDDVNNEKGFLAVAAAPMSLSSSSPVNYVQGETGSGVELVNTTHTDSHDYHDNHDNISISIAAATPPPSPPPPSHSRSSITQWSHQVFHLCGRFHKNNTRNKANLFGGFLQVCNYIMFMFI